MYSYIDGIMGALGGVIGLLLIVPLFAFGLTMLLLFLYPFVAFFLAAPVSTASHEAAHKPAA
jgi:hypothetical protein